MGDAGYSDAIPRPGRIPFRLKVAQPLDHGARVQQQLFGFEVKPVTPQAQISLCQDIGDTG